MALEEKIEEKVDDLYFMYSYMEQKSTIYKDGQKGRNFIQWLQTSADHMHLIPVQVYNKHGFQVNLRVISRTLGGWS